MHPRGRSADPALTAGELGNAVDALASRFARPPGGLAVGAIAGAHAVARGYGGAHAGTIFEIGSVTKVFTAILLADLAAEGVLGLDEPLDACLPRGTIVPTRDGVRATLADVATHTAGLPSAPPGFLRHALRHRGDPWAALTAEELLAALARTRLRHVPGGRFRYSNFGFGLLGHALAHRAGAPYEELLARRICQPLDLRDTSVAIDPAAAIGRVAQGHSSRGRPAAPWHLPAIAAAGALHSTATDLLAFLRACLEPPSSPPGAALAATLVPRFRIRRHLAVGLAWLLIGGDGAPTLAWHNGGTGGFRSFVGLSREPPVAVVVLSARASSVDRLGMRLLAALGAGPARGRRPR